MARFNAPVTRRSFSRLQNPLEVPHLIDIQRRSFAELTDPKKGLLRETINDISPIEDYTGNLAIVSRSPSSMNHWKEAFWMSMRFGRSRTCFRREKDLRALGAARVLLNLAPPYFEMVVVAGETAGRRRNS